MAMLDDALTDLQQRIAALEREVDARTAERDEALAQQSATAEVLQVINSSPGDLRPVFDAILDKAHTLCGATRGTLFLFDGQTFRAAVTQGYPEDFANMLRQGISSSQTAFATLVAGARLVHIRDLTQLGDPVSRAVAERGGVRTNLLLPLRQDDTLLGVISCNRAEVRPFSENEIALLQNFAAQAVIAIENARLFNELRDRTDELARRQAELRVTFDNMGDGVAMFDAEQRLAAWNRNFQELLELPDTFLVERPSFAAYFRYLAARGEYGSADLEAELSHFVEDTDREMRLERTRPDGRVVEVRRNTVPGGGFVLIYSDVTERKRAEAQIRAARDAAEKALQELQAAQASLLHAQKMAALGQLTAGIAHEIKNPLNFVNNFADLSVELLDELKETAAPAITSLADDTRAEIDEIVGMLTGNLEKIAEHGRRADGIVKSMLAHSRGSSGERQTVDISSLVDESLNLAYHGARAQDQNFNITLERDLDFSIAPIELVPQDVTRVFLNLFGNGFYAADKRGKEANEKTFRPTLKVTTRDLGANVEIRVRDNGAGIPPEVEEKLFQPFFTTKPTGEGTGLGLSISYDIVAQQHGGTITVDSREGEFTEFTVRLPRSRQGATSRMNA
jgi:two-component system NtrC family sensor kinase